MLRVLGAFVPSNSSVYATFHLCFFKATQLYSVSTTMSIKQKLLQLLSMVTMNSLISNHTIKEITHCPES